MKVEDVFPEKSSIIDVTDFDYLQVIWCTSISDA